MIGIINQSINKYLKTNKINVKIIKNKIMILLKIFLHIKDFLFFSINSLIL